MKTCWNLLLLAALCFTLTSCDKDDERQPAELLLGEWTAVASEGWTKDGETLIDSWTWENGDSEGDTAYIFYWWKFNQDATGEWRSGKLTWTLAENVLRIKIGPTSSGFTAVIFDYNVLEISDESLVIDFKMQNSSSGTLTYEKITYGRK